MLNTLMDISEAESGDDAAAPRAGRPLTDVVARAVDLYRDVADAKGVALTRRAPRTTSSVTGDRVRLEQVAANLLDNADQVHARRRPGRAIALVPDGRPGDPAGDATPAPAFQPTSCRGSGIVCSAATAAAPSAASASA